MKLFAATASTALLLTLACLLAPAPAGAHPAKAPKKCRKAQGGGSKPRFQPATVYQVADGSMPAGSEVCLDSAVLTAVTPSGETAWLGSQPGDPGYAGAEYSGIEIDLSGLSPIPAVAVGDRVTAYGSVVAATTGSQLAASGLRTEASEEPVAPVDISASTLLSPSESGPLDAVLTRIPNLTLTGYSGSDWVMSGGVVLGSAIIGELPNFFPELTQFESVTGIADTVGSEPHLLPRDYRDFLLGA